MPAQLVSPLRRPAVGRVARRALPALPDGAGSRGRRRYLLPLRGGWIGSGP